MYIYILSNFCEGNPCSLKVHVIKFFSTIPNKARMEGIIFHRY